MRGTRSELKHLTELALPIALAQLATIGMQLVDTLFMGQLGPAAIGGVGIGNSVYAVILLLGLGLLFGMDYVASHAFGADRIEDVNQYLVQGLYLATAVSFPSMVLMWVIADQMHIFGIDPAAAVQAGIFLKTATWSLWPTLLFSAIRQYLQAMNIASPVLYILLAANIVNAFFNYVLVFGNWGAPRLEVQGSATATIIARIFMLAGVVIYAISLERRRKLGLRRVSLKFSREMMGRIFKLGFPASIQMTLEVGVFATATFLAGRLGAVPLAAHHIVLQIASVTFMIPLGISSAAAVRVAQHLGRAQPERARAVGFLSIGLAAGFMTAVGILLYFCAAPILRAFTPDSEVIAIGAMLIVVAALFQLFDAIQVVATGALRGIGNTRASMIINLVGHWFFGLPVSYVLAFHLGWGALGLWIGLSVGLIAVSSSLLMAWRRLAPGVRVPA